MTDSATQSAKKDTMTFLRSFLELILYVYSPNFLACARYRLFAHTKRDIAVAGHMRCGTFSGKGGSSFALCGKVFPGRTKKSSVRASPPKNSARDRTDDRWVFFQTHGNLSLGGWQTESRNRSHTYDDKVPHPVPCTLNSAFNQKP